MAGLRGSSREPRFPDGNVLGFADSRLACRRAAGCRQRWIATVLRSLPRLVAALAAVMLGGASAHAAPATPAEAADLVRAVERRYASIKSLTASFTQTFRSGEL